MAEHENWLDSRQERTWSYSTKYDLAHRAALVELFGRKDKRVKDVDNYVHFINSRMSESYAAVSHTQPVPEMLYEKYSSRAWNTEQDSSTLYYTINSDGELEEYARMKGIYVFYGDRAIIQEDNVYIAQSQYNIAIKPPQRVDLVNIDPNDDESQRKRFEYFQSSMKLLLRNESPYLL